MTQYVMDTIFLSGAPLPDFDLSVDCQTLHIVNKTIEDCVVSYAFSDGWSTADIDPFHTFPGNGVYDVTITLTNECGPTDTVIQVTINAFPEALFTFTQQDNHIQFINESYCSDSSYWDFGDGTFSAEFNPWHSYSATGMYIVTLEAISIPNNDLFTDTIFVWSISTVEDPSVAAIRIFPNPARDLLQIEISDHGFQVAELFSTDGLLVRQFRISDKHISLPVSELASGQYYLRLTGNNIVSTKKVVLLK
jgi:PKD repeat protein